MTAEKRKEKKSKKKKKTIINYARIVCVQCTIFLEEFHSRLACVIFHLD